jgi:DNA-binding ferritin-like protein (Dps family)
MTMALKWIEHKREWRRYKARVAALPPGYRTAVAGIERYTTYLGGIDDADSIVVMCHDLADLFEQAAADGVPVRDVVGEEPVEFAEAFLRNYPAGSWITRERDRLSRAIDQAEALGGGSARAS